MLYDLLQGDALHVGDVLRQVEIALHDDSDVAEVFGRDRAEYVATDRTDREHRKHRKHRIRTSPLPR